VRHLFSSGPQRWWLLAALVWAALIFIGSSVSSAGSPGDVTLKGAVEHMIEYFVLAALLRRSGLAWTACLLSASAYGASDEFHQAFVAGRDASAMDLVFDVVGSTLGASFVPTRWRDDDFPPPREVDA
jgi:VanZ family protein